MIYLQLFFSFLQIGLFSFGGGYAAMPLIQGQVVNIHGWLEMSEFTDLITISQMTPGPIGINMATYVGFEIFGLPGAVVATLGLIFPSIVVIIIIAGFLQKFRQSKAVDAVFYGLRPASTGLMPPLG